jgi:hypothetical protein
LRVRRKEDIMIDRRKIPPQVKALDIVKGILGALFCTITDTERWYWLDGLSG